MRPLLQPSRAWPGLRRLFPKPQKDFFEASPRYPDLSGFTVPGCLLWVRKLLADPDSGPNNAVWLDRGSALDLGANSLALPQRRRRRLLSGARGAAGRQLSPPSGCPRPGVTVP